MERGVRNIFVNHYLFNFEKCGVFLLGGTIHVLGHVPPPIPPGSAPMLMMTLIV